MKYYLIFLQSGIVVDISSYDDEFTRNQAWTYWTTIDQNVINGSAYDRVQCFNQVV